MSSTTRINPWYALMDRSHIYGFPNPMHHVDWSTHLPMFKDENKDDVGLHLVKFHIHVCTLRVEFPKDCLMKMFMATLEDKSRVWYEGLKSGSLCSLKDFHRIFFGHYGKSYLASPLFEYCCNLWKFLIQYIKIIDDDVECMDDEETLEALYEFYSQVSSHDDQEIFQQADVSYLVEDEMDL